MSAERITDRKFPRREFLRLSVRGGLGVLMAVGLTKSTAIVGRDMVSPITRGFGEAVKSDFEKEWGGLSEEEKQAREECLSGFSCEKLDAMNQGRTK